MSTAMSGLFVPFNFALRSRFSSVSFDAISKALRESGGLSELRMSFSVENAANFSDSPLRVPSSSMFTVL